MRPIEFFNELTKVYFLAFKKVPQSLLQNIGINKNQINAGGK